MSSVDLALRYLIITVAWHLACAWVQTFQSPYPIADAFELADTAEEQLFKSLGISWRSLSVAISKVLFFAEAVNHLTRLIQDSCKTDHRPNCPRSVEPTIYSPLQVSPSLQSHC